MVDPAEWFALADIVFDMYEKATEKQKFGVSLAHIPPDLVTQHKSQWEGASDPYTQLKASITGATAKTSAQLFLDLHGLSYNCKPSDYARQAAAILHKIPETGSTKGTASQVKGWLIKGLVENKLPSNVRPTLAKREMDTDKLQDYTDEADKLVNA